MALARHHVEVGDVVGELTVIQVGLRAEQTPLQRERRQVGERAALCSCTCGGARIVKIGSLVTNRVSTCGCAPQPRREPPPAEVEDAPRRRGGRAPREIPTEAFQPMIDAFILAAAIDVGYAEAICRSATRIAHKRMQWECRLALRAAEAAAREACAASDLTSCEIQNPCGTGSCPMGSPEFAHIDAPAVARGVPSARRATRPQPRTGPGFEYTVESALPLVVAEREAF
jgi:hypothetical protein